MKQGRKKIIFTLISVLFIVLLLPITASADSGPKPSVRVSFLNMSDEPCYGTLLSKNPSTGPASAWNGDEEYAYHNGNDRYQYIEQTEEIWRAFVEYEDSDGYYFLQHTWDLSKKQEIDWTYYPPKSFKILLYYPETDEFLVSGICEKYAFDSYFTVDMADLNSNSDPRINARVAYRWQEEAVSLVARIFITIAVEMAIALLFGFKEKRALIILITVNSITQIILNVMLNLINFSSGQAAFVTEYINLEILVFVIEAVLYSVLMRYVTKEKKPALLCVAYSLAANAASFATGLWLANIIPGIF